jgi:hypothetical protein
VECGHRRCGRGWESLLCYNIPLSLCSMERIRGCTSITLCYRYDDLVIPQGFDSVRIVHKVWVSQENRARYMTYTKLGVAMITRVHDCQRSPMLGSKLVLATLPHEGA